jgi:hypothetical protein
MIAAAAMPPNIFAASVSCSRASSRISPANTAETKNEKISIKTKWLCMTIDYGPSAIDYFRPIEISKASMTTSALSRPATIRNVLPYSYVTAVTTPAP